MAGKGEKIAANLANVDGRVAGLGGIIHGDDLLGARRQSSVAGLTEPIVLEI